MSFRRILCIGIVFMFVGTAIGQEKSEDKPYHPVMQFFGAWGTLDFKEKTTMYLGFTNGFFLHRSPTAADLSQCITTIPLEQAVAMIDKFYKNNPEKWTTWALGEGILRAITVEGGPCADEYPWK